MEVCLVQSIPAIFPKSQDPGAEEKFKDISEAYAVLSDPEKHKKYDQFGHAGIESLYSQEDLFRGVNFERFAERLWLRGRERGRRDGGDNIFDMFFGGSSRQRKPVRGKDLRYEIQITLEQAATGLNPTIEVLRAEKCATCHGSGAKHGTTPTTCGNCHGTGQINSAQNTSFGQMITSSMCPKCGGKGQIIFSPCRDCSGSGRVQKSRNIKVKIPAGVENGQHLKLRGQGDADGQGMESGDLYVRIKIMPHPTFQRIGNDPFLETPISIIRAALGTDLVVPILSGKAKIKVPRGTQTGTVFRLKGKGMPGCKAWVQAI